MEPGELQSVDGYMNIALEQTKEYVDGKLRRNYGDAFVRGNNGLVYPITIAFHASLLKFRSHVYFRRSLSLQGIQVFEKQGDREKETSARNTRLDAETHSARHPEKNQVRI